MTQPDPALIANGRQRMRIAMSRGRADCVPTMPQICHPHAVHVLEKDYRRGIAETIENPRRRYELVLEVARRYEVDGLRLFALPEPLRIGDEGAQMIAFDPETDCRVGGSSSTAVGQEFRANLQTYMSPSLKTSWY